MIRTLKAVLFWHIRWAALILVLLAGLLLGLLAGPANAGDCDVMAALIMRQTALEQRLWILEDRMSTGKKDTWEIKYQIKSITLQIKAIEDRLHNERMKNAYKKR